MRIGGDNEPAAKKSKKKIPRKKTRSRPNQREVDRSNTQTISGNEPKYNLLNGCLAFVHRQPLMRQHLWINSCNDYYNRSNEVFAMSVNLLVDTAVSSPSE